MRITTGKFKGQKIIFPTSPNTRPMMDYVKQSLFNALHARISFEGVRVLDLFAGSGQLGLEALSRGASFCYFNEPYRPTLSTLKQNLYRVPPACYSIFDNDYMVVLHKLATANISLDLIFLDPPFAETEFYNKTVEYIISAGLLHKEGFIIVEASQAFNWGAFGLQEIFCRQTKNKFWWILANRELQT